MSQRHVTTIEYREGGSLAFYLNDIAVFFYTVDGTEVTITNDAGHVLFDGYRPDAYRFWSSLVWPIIEAMNK